MVYNYNTNSYRVWYAILWNSPMTERKIYGTFRYECIQNI